MSSSCVLLCVLCVCVFGVCVFHVCVFGVCAPGPGAVEEPQEERVPGPDQEGGGEEDDGEAPERRRGPVTAEEEHQDLQGDRAGQVRVLNSLKHTSLTLSHCHTS